MLNRDAESTDTGHLVELLKDYQREVEADPCFHSFDAELGRLLEVYARPYGCLLVAVDSGEIAGCGALRRILPDAAELKRLYVRPEFRGRGIARVIATSLLSEAQNMGYSRVLLDTLEQMHAARTLYRSLGFQSAPAYYDNPVPGVLCFVRHLEPSEELNR